MCVVCVCGGGGVGGGGGGGGVVVVVGGGGGVLGLWGGVCRGAELYHDKCVLLDLNVNSMKVSKQSANISSQIYIYTRNINRR